MKDKSESSGEIRFAEAKIFIDGPNAGQVIEASDEELAAEQGIKVEELREARSIALAKAYSFILKLAARKRAKDKAEDISE